MSKQTPQRKSHHKVSNATQPVTGNRLLTAKRNVARRYVSYLQRRPHRSFRRTLKRDYVRSLELPGYWSFTIQSLKLVWSNRRLFSLVVATYVIMGAIFVGLSPQSTYGQLSQLLDQSGKDIFSGGWGTIGQAGLLLLSSASGSINAQYTEAQQIFSALILLLTWLTTVWLLRSILAGNKPRLRDGLYNSGAPIVATGIVFLVALLQLLPATLGVIVFSSAVSTSLFQSGFMAMIVSLAVGVLVVLSVYWVVSTLIALIIVTLPGMYPWQAIRTAGDIVVGRRLRLLLRILWMTVGNTLFWIVAVLPLILVERAVVKAFPFIGNIPIIPFVIAIVSSVIVVWSATYMYLLYRKVVDDDAKPA